ncbi:MAG: YdcF family protein [Bacteroidota bacterium]
MFFVLSKISYFFISPFTWLLIALAGALFVKSIRWRKRFKYAVIIIAVIFSNSFIFKEAVRLWEVPSISIDEIEHHQVGIVLGGMFEYDNDTERLSIRRGGDRIWQAIDLYKRNKIDQLLLSGDHGFVTDRGLHEAQQLKEVLVRWGIPEKDIIIEGRSKNTYENAKFTAQQLKTSYPHLDAFVLITSAKHMKRAQACFEKQGLSVTPFPTDPFVGSQRAYHWDEFIVPNVRNFQYWFSLNKELLGYVVYGIMGYL